MGIKKFSRKTLGFNGNIHIGKAIAMTTQATEALFIANAAVGELGVYLDTGANVAIALTANQVFRVLQRTTQGVKATPYTKWSDVVASKRLYNAPTLQVSQIGFNRTGGDMNAATIAAGQNFGFKIIETTEGNDPFPTWNYEYYTGPTDVMADVIQAIVAKMNNKNAAEHKQNQRLLNAVATSKATYGNYTLGGTTPTATFTNGSTLVALGGTTPALNAVVGDFIAVSSTGQPSATLGDTYKVVAISAGVSITLNRPYQGATIVMNQAQAQGTRLNVLTAFTAVGIEVTTIDPDVSFTMAVYDSAVYATLTYTTATIKGNGTYTNALLWENEGQTYNGDTAKNNAFAADFGQQDTFVTSTTETYDFIHLNALKTEYGNAPAARHGQNYSAVLVLPKSAGAQTAAFATIFGV